MKQMKTMMAGMVLCTALFTACNKASYEAIPDSSTSLYSQAKIGDNSNMMFTAGNLNTTYISIKSKGAPLAEYRHHQYLELWELLERTGLPLPPDKYPAMETTIEIAPSDG